jgi:hypothetical protein
MTPRILTAAALGSGLALRLFADDVNTLLAEGATHLEVHRCDTASGSFVEVSTSLTRPKLVKNRVVYTFSDATGAASKFYKIRLLYSSAANGPFSDVFAGTTRGLVSLAEARAAGIASGDADDATLTRRLLSAERWVEAATGQWFEPRAATYNLRGSGREVLRIAVPIIAAEALYLAGETTALAETQWLAHTSRTYPDDRDAPRIELITPWRSGQRLFSRSPGLFDKGVEPHKLVGTLGYIESDGMPPGPIVDAIVAVTKRDIITPGTLDGLQGPLKKLTVDRASEEYASGASMPSNLSLLAFMAGDTKTLATLSFYKRRAPSRTVGRSYDWGRTR